MGIFSETSVMATAGTTTRSCTRAMVIMGLALLLLAAPAAGQQVRVMHASYTYIYLYMYAAGGR
jgi:hypothetical protein